MTDGFSKTLEIVKGELEEVMNDLKDQDIVPDPDGSGSVTIPAALYFQVLGIITWLAEPGEADGK